MSEEDRWAKVRQIVREEIEAAFQKFGGKAKAKIDLVSGRWIGITPEQKEAWEAAYGAVDLTAELARAAAWCVSNPHLAPKSQMGRFINTWLSRCQNQASLRSIPTERATEVKQKLCGYCERVATSSTNGIWSCDQHSLDAMDGKPRPRMFGVAAKNVTGER